MGAFAGVVRGALAGLNTATGNDQTAQALQQKNQQAQQSHIAELRAQVLPHSFAIKGLQAKLQSIDPQKNPEEYSAVHHDIARNLAEIRGIIYPDKDPKGNFFERGITDKLHLTSLKNRQDKEKSTQAKGAAQDESGATAIEQGTVPLTQDPKYLQSRALETQRTTAADALEDKRLTGQKQLEQMRIDQQDKKPLKGLKVLGSESSPYGVQNEDTGKQYLPSQLGSNGDAPPEAKQIWNTLQQAKQAKVDEENKKEDERTARQAKTIAAGFERMGRTQEFQENMAQYRADLTTFRGLDKDARNSEETVKALESQYSQPGNKAVADNELQNFYTSVVQKGGRKTAAELALTLKIGSLGMNLQTMAQKAASGELPEQLRKELLSGMKAVANEQRAVADQTKPELPQVTAPGAKGTKALKETRQAQKSGRPDNAHGTVQYQGKTYWVDKEGNNLGLKN